MEHSRRAELQNTGFIRTRKVWIISSRMSFSIYLPAPTLRYLLRISLTPSTFFIGLKVINLSLRALQLAIWCFHIGSKKYRVARQTPAPLVSLNPRDSKLISSQRKLLRVDCFAPCATLTVQPAIDPKLNPFSAPYHSLKSSGVNFSCRQVSVLHHYVRCHCWQKFGCV